MTDGSQRGKAIRLRELHAGPPILVLPNAWDAISARMFEAEGFPAIGTTSAGVANVLGYPDGEMAPRDEVLFLVRRIAQTVRVPVTADIEAGYGAEAIPEVLVTVRGALDAGAVEVNLEDSVPATGALVDIGLQREKVQAVRALGVSAGVPIVINARTDAFHLAHMAPREQFETAVKRANAYRAAGANSLFVPFIADARVIGDLAKAIDGPINILAVPGTPRIGELARLGVARVSVGSGPHRATLALVRRIAAELHGDGAYDSFTGQTIPYPEVNRLLADRSD